MYEAMRSDILKNLSDILSSEELTKVMEVIDNVACDYNVARKSKALVRYDSSIPPEVKGYIVSRSIEGLSKTTIDLYTGILRKFFADLQKPVNEVQMNDIRVWLYIRQSSTSKRTAELYRVILNSFFTWCVGEGHVPVNPMLKIRPIHYVRNSRKALSPMDLQIIRTSCQDVRERAIVEMLYSTGCRVSELANALKNNVDFDRAQMAVIGKGGKARIVYINTRALIALREYLSTRDDNSPYLFVSEREPHTHLTKSGIERIITLLSKRTNINVTPHIFRHTTATNALQNGMPVQNVQKMLGHSKIDTTMIYAQVCEDDVKSNHRHCVI